jgi:hypothetical protein
MAVRELNADCRKLIAAVPKCSEFGNAVIAKT